MSPFPDNKTSGYRRRTAVIVLFILLSLLAHLLLIQFLPLPEPTPGPASRTPIELVEYPAPVTPPEEEQQQPDYEIDQMPILPEPDEPVQSHRRAEQDQQVEKEQAPEGDDVRDQTRLPVAEAAPVTEPAAPLLPEPPTTDPPVSSEPTPQEQRIERVQTEKQEPSTATPKDPEEVQPEPPQLTREQLFPSHDTMRRIVEGRAGEQERRKEREDVEVGETVWLNLQNDRLVSFFRRLHDRIDRVWNYPAEAAQNGIEGTLELLIIVSRDGELIDVDLKQTSGSDILDFEAIQAVYRAAPFGPLGRHYPHDELRIRAHFRYRISGRYIFGR